MIQILKSGIFARKQNDLNTPLVKFSLPTRITGNLFLAVVVFIVFLPIGLALLYSFLPPGIVPNIRSISDIVENFSMQGYQNVFRQTPFMRIMGNSIFVSLTSTVLQLTISFMTAYALTHWDYPGKDYIFGFVIIVMIIPSVALFIPNYLTINHFNMVNTYAGVITPGIANAYGIFLMRQFFRKVPKSLIEACRMDGGNELYILRHIYLPICRPAATALFIILLVANWNDFQWTMIVLNDPNMITLPLAIVRFRDEGFIDWMATAAACLMAILPMLILYLLMQRQILDTFASSATKE